MSRSINDFIGEWHVSWLDGVNPIIDRDSKIEIGNQPAIQPFLLDGEVCVGYAVYLNGQTQPRLTSAADGPLVLADGNLRWIGQEPDGREVRIYLSVAEAFTQDNGRFLSLYGTTLHGDPEQVAVWGANGG